MFESYVASLVTCKYLEMENHSCWSVSQMETFVLMELYKTEKAIFEKAFNTFAE